MSLILLETIAPGLITPSLASSFVLHVVGLFLASIDCAHCSLGLQREVKVTWRMNKSTMKDILVYLFSTESQLV